MRFHSIAGTDGMDNFFRIDTNQLFARMMFISKSLFATFISTRCEPEWFKILKAYAIIRIPATAL